MTPRRVRITGDLYHPVVPDDAVRVTRPTRWGNRHPMGKPCRACDGAVHGTRQRCIDLYRRDLLADPAKVERARRELAGKDLACWCDLSLACHASVLLEIANEDQEEAATGA